MHTQPALIRLGKNCWHQRLNSKLLRPKVVSLVGMAKEKGPMAKEKGSGLAMCTRSTRLIA